MLSRASEKSSQEKKPGDRGELHNNQLVPTHVIMLTTLQIVKRAKNKSKIWMQQGSEEGFDMLISKSSVA